MTRMSPSERAGCVRCRCQPAWVLILATVFLVSAPELWSGAAAATTTAARYCDDIAIGRASGRFLTKLRTSKTTTCSLDPQRQLPSNRLNCSASACCTASDCSRIAGSPLAWLCACDDRCGRNRCFMLAESCGRLEPVHGGYYVRESNDFVRLRCNKGFRRTGPLRRQCRNGNWYSREPHWCVQRCKPPTLPPNAQLAGTKKKKFYIHDNRVEGECSAGYKLVSRVKTSRMLLTCKYGRWRPRVTRFACLPDLDNPCCHLPIRPENGHVDFLTGRNTTLCKGQAVEYRCDECYALAADAAKRVVCDSRDQRFTPPTCRRVTCRREDIALPRGATVETEDQSTEHDCSSVLTIRCRDIHNDLSGRRQHATCHANGSWSVGGASDGLRCTPPAVGSLRVEGRTADAVSLSWLPPSALANFTAAYWVTIREGTDSQAPVWEHSRNTSYPTGDSRFASDTRFHAQLVGLSPSTWYTIEVTTVDADGFNGGTSRIQVTTNVQLTAKPIQCIARAGRLYAVWEGDQFPADTTYEVSYATTQSIVSPYRDSWRAAVPSGTNEVYLQGVQPYTTYGVELLAQHSSIQESRRRNCTLASDDAIPRPPPVPVVVAVNGQFVVELQPSHDLFVKAYKLIIRKYSSPNVVQNSWKYAFSPAELSTRAQPTGLVFTVPDTAAAPVSTVFKFQLVAVSPRGQESASRAMTYLT